ncbi:hypothetical protein Tco_0015795 [Tanacetum coccineum]
MSMPHKNQAKPQPSLARCGYVFCAARKSTMVGTDISQKDEKPSKKRQNRTRDGKVCEDEAQSKSSQLREEKAKKNIT